MIESYKLFIASNSTNHTIHTPTTSLYASLAYNVEFAISVASVNYAGQSEHLALTKIIFGKPCGCSTIPCST
jgi:DNA-dependent RNA polymerase auxiliary subunit epsilon